MNDDIKFERGIASPPTGLTIIIPTWDRAAGIAAATKALEMATVLRTQAIVLTTSDIPEENRTDQLLAHGHYHKVGGPVSSEALMPVPAMSLGYAAAQLLGIGAINPGEIFLFTHDDVTIEGRGWDQVLLEFFDAHPSCGLAGFGGAMGFGRHDIYRTPYELQQLERYGFLSNMREGHVHGGLLEEPQRAAVLDGFSLAIRSEVYEEIGGWLACLAAGIPFHMYDAWISLAVQQAGWQVWMLPVACHHAGGGTSVRQQLQYERVVRRAGYADGQQLFNRAHERIYELFRGMLPIRL